MKLVTHMHIANQVHTKFEDDIHKLFFKIGNTLPDILPNMRFRPHTMKSSYDYLQARINKLSCKNHWNIFSSIKMGIITHFIADFVCKPHRIGYDGSIFQHRSYEVNLVKFHNSYHEDFTKSIAIASEIINEMINFRAFSLKVIKEAI